MSDRRFLYILFLLFYQISLASDITFQPIYFESQSSKLNGASKEALGRVAQLLKNSPSVKLELVGHTALEGTDVNLEKLSLERAEKARTYLVEKFKIAADRLTAVGKGHLEPYRKDEKNSIENRRVEFRFLDQSQKSSVAKKELETINVLYWNTLYHSLYQIGNEKGYFEREGFKLHLIGTNHSLVNQVKAICSIEPFLRSGEYVFSGAVCGGSPHEAIAKGVPLVVIGGMLAGGSLLMAKPAMAKKLKASWSNFKGIRIGRPKGTLITSMIISDQLKKAGIDHKKEIIWKEYDAHEAVVEAIANGEIDAGDTYVPLNIRAHKKYGLVEVYNTVQLFPFHPCCRVITTQAKLKANRPKYVKFMKAIIRSHEFFVKTPNPAIKIVEKYTGYSHEEVELSLKNPNFILNPDPLKNGFIKFWHMMNDTGYIQSKRDISKYVDTTVYESALEALIKEEPNNDYFKFMRNQFRVHNTM